MWPKALPPSCPGMRPKRDVECCLINILTRKHKLGIFQRCTRCRPGHSPLCSGGHSGNQPVIAELHYALCTALCTHSEPFSENYCTACASLSLLTNCCQLNTELSTDSDASIHSTVTWSLHCKKIVTPGLQQLRGLLAACLIQNYFLIQRMLRF